MMGRRREQVLSGWCVVQPHDVRSVFHYNEESLKIEYTGLAYLTTTGGSLFVPPTNKVIHNYRALSASEAVTLRRKCGGASLSFGTARIDVLDRLQRRMTDVKRYRNRVADAVWLERHTDNPDIRFYPSTPVIFAPKFKRNGRVVDEYLSSANCQHHCDDWQPVSYAEALEYIRLWTVHGYPPDTRCGKECAEERAEAADIETAIRFYQALEEPQLKEVGNG